MRARATRLQRRWWSAGRETLSSVVASQISAHARYGGVVPELASREHLRAIVPVVRAALAEAGVGFEDLDAIAVTAGPGLAGALLVGITFAKALAFARELPVIAVNHLEGHIHAVLLEQRERRAVGNPTLRAELALEVMGAHPSVWWIEPGWPCSFRRAHASLPGAGGAGGWRYKNVGRTVDDAAGEAYDKVAKLLGLGYPGGPWIDALARFGDPRAVPFSFAQIKTEGAFARRRLRGRRRRTPRLSPGSSRV